MYADRPQRDPCWHSWERPGSTAVSVGCVQRPLSWEGARDWSAQSHWMVSVLFLEVEEGGKRDEERGEEERQRRGEGEERRMKKQEGQKRMKKIEEMKTKEGRRWDEEEVTRREEGGREGEEKKEKRDNFWVTTIILPPIHSSQGG